MFALLLNTEFDTAERIKIIIEIAIETTIKIWQKLRPKRENYLSRRTANLDGRSAESTGPGKGKSIRSR